jgi:diguanylate cyclase (GGDEF)-like protein
MRLLTRLWLVLGGLFLVPIAVSGLVLFVAVPDARSERADDTVRLAGDAVAAELADACRLLGVAARGAVLEAGADGPQRAVEVVVDSGYGDYAALLGRDGAVVAEAGRLAAGAGAPDELARCSDDGGSGSGVLAERAEADGPPGTSTGVVVRNLDADFLDELRLAGALDGEVVLLSGDRVVASTLDADAARDVARAVGDEMGVQTADGWTVNALPARPGVPFSLIVGVESTRGGGQLLLLALVLALGVVVAGSLVTVVARGLSQPFSELTEAAERVAQGDLDAPITAGGDEGEAGRLGSAFSQMTDELRRSLRELERSREELRDSLERIGEALTNTHDLDGLLQVVLETALATLDAKAGVILYRSADQLQLVGELGLDDAGLTPPAVVSAGTGVLGRVVSSGAPVRGTLGSGPPQLAPTDSEPSQGEILAVPLRSMGAVIGVVALYDRTGERTFDAADQDGLATLAGQASIAIDNVQLHQEAQRLSTTDALTGLWNFRYLSMSLAREIERSTRFDRPLAVLMLDLDHFKAVNDEHGHPRGDTVLRELAHRVQEQIREVDTFARYGGEEFVVVLPETTVEGAAQLADRICVAVRREPFRHDGEEPLDISVSIGGAAFPDHGSSPATLMRAADKALYVAKAEGRDRWHMPGV